MANVTTKTAALDAADVADARLEAAVRAHRAAKRAHRAAVRGLRTAAAAVAAVRVGVCGHAVARARAEAEAASGAAYWAAVDAE